GDVIIDFDGHPIRDSARLPRYVSAAKPGASAEVDVLREGSVVSRTIDVKALPDGESPPPASQPAKPLPGLGLSVTPQAGSLKIDSIDPASSAVGALAVGDIVLDVDRQPVASQAELDAAVQAHHGKSPLLVRIRRGDLTVFVPIEAIDPQRAADR